MVPNPRRKTNETTDEKAKAAGALSDPMQLASVIAHQLKSPITSAVSILQTLKGGFVGPLSARQQEMLQKAIDRCRESLDTAGRLLSISQALRQSAEFQGQADLIFLVHRARMQYQDQATQRDISLSLDIETPVAQVRGNESALAESVDALLNNALKYTPDHGRVAIRIQAGKRPDTLCLSIADSGMGIPPAERDRIFEPFTRSRAARASGRPGTGLGLSFVKTIVEASGGTIEVDGAALGGAEFRVILPAGRQEHPLPDKGESVMSNALRVIIIGGVAAGPKVAAKVARLDPVADVTIIDKGKLLSYAGCGLPYYISGVVREQNQLVSSPVGVVRDPVFFQKVKHIHIMNQTEAIQIDRAQKRVRIRDCTSGAESWRPYDKLVLATGAVPILPDNHDGRWSNVFSLHGVNDAEGIKAVLEAGKAHDVVILGGGLIGVEITEALVRKGCRVTIVEKRNQILHDIDWEMAKLVERHLESHGVKVLTNTIFEGFQGDGRISGVQTSRGVLPADLAVLALGIQPNVELARQADLAIGPLGGIKVDSHLRTSDPDIYAAGDCVESVNFFTRQPSYEPFGSIANKQGRVVATNLCGGRDTFPATLHSVACQVFEYGVARTGLNEQTARNLGYEVVTVLAPSPDREHFVPGAKLLMLKLVVDAKSRRLLGAQAIGPGHPDKRIDVASMAISSGLTVDQIANLDLCYAPRFSAVMDNLITAANIARNKLAGAMVGITPMELHRRLVNQEEGILLLDVRTLNEYEQERLPHSRHIPLGILRERMGELPRDRLIVTFCNISLRGYEAALILRAAGFADVRVLDGGLDMWPYEKLQ